MKYQTQTKNNELDTMVSTFLSSNYTEADIVRSLNILKTFLEQYYFVESGEKNFEQSMRQLQESENVTEIDLKLLANIGQSHSSYFSRDSFYERLDALAKALYSLPKIVLHIPVRLDYFSLQRIGQWIRTNVSEKAILTTRIDPLLVAGTSIGWNSQFIEFSFDQKIQRNKQQLYSLLPTL